MADGFQVTLAVREVWGKLLISLGCGFEVLPLDSQLFLPLYTEVTDRDGSIRQVLSSFSLILSYTDRQELFSRRLKQLAPVEPIFHQVDTCRLKAHITDYLLEPVTGITRSIKLQPALPLPADTQQYLLLHPGSGHPRKNWPEENFLLLAEELRPEIPVQILLGPAEETSLSFWEKGGWKEKVILSSTPEKLMEALKAARLFLGNDSGVTHLAAATGLPTLAIFGPTDPAVWAPRGKKVCLLYKKTRCSPCLPATRISHCRQECLRQISVADVVSAVRTLWTKLA